MFYWCHGEQIGFHLAGGWHLFLRLVLLLSLKGHVCAAGASDSLDVLAVLEQSWLVVLLPQAGNQ